MQYVRNFTLINNINNNKQGCPKYANILAWSVIQLTSQFMVSFLHRFHSITSIKSIAALLDAKYESLTQISLYRNIFTGHNVK